MSRNFKKTVAFIFFLIGGIILGAFISHFCANIPYLSWLSWGQEIGFATNSPAVVDLMIFKLVFGFSLNFTIAQVFTIMISLIIYNKTSKNL